MLFDFIFNKKKDNRVKVYFSNDMLFFFNYYKNLPKTNELLSYEGKKNICFVDFSNKIGYVNVYQSSNYLNELKKYNLDSEKFEYYKNNINEFIKDYNFDIKSKYQLMKMGKLINKLIDIDPYFVESYSIRYKYYQIGKNN